MSFPQIHECSVGEGDVYMLLFPRGQMPTKPIPCAGCPESSALICFLLLGIFWSFELESLPMTLHAQRALEHSPRLPFTYQNKLML